MKMGRHGSSHLDGREEHQNNFELQSFTSSRPMLENDMDALQPDAILLSRNCLQTSSRINEGPSSLCNERMPIKLPPNNHSGLRGFFDRIKDIRKKNDSLSCHR